jgi:elongation factor G
MLFLGGETKSIGRVDSGDTVMDFLPQERERGITISSSAISFEWKNKKINLIDT